MTSTEAPPSLLPDRASHLSDGVVVETRLTARLLGMRLLRVDGVIALSPARLVGAAPTAPYRNRVTVPSRLLVADADPTPTGTALLEAARLLRENDERLRRAGRSV